MGLERLAYQQPPALVRREKWDHTGDKNPYGHKKVGSV